MRGRKSCTWGTKMSWYGNLGLLWGLQGSTQRKTGRRSNGFHLRALGGEVRTWRTAARMADDDAPPFAKFPP